MSAISIAQIIVSILLVAVILLQERSSGLSGVFGGDSEFYHTRRGLEKIIFWSTIVLAITFGVLSLISGLS
jgi:preprotein translocase subunit SecG